MALRRPSWGASVFTIGLLVRPDDVTLALTRPAPIDGGIVMAHMALASAVLGRKEEWQVRWRDAALALECGLPQDVIPVATFGPSARE